MVHAALRIMVKEFRMSADPGNGLNKFDLRVAAPAERQMKPKRRGFAQIGLVLKFRFFDEQKLRYAELVLEKSHALVNVGYDKSDLKDVLGQCGCHSAPPCVTMASNRAIC
jgi:hypothetical protein